MTNTPTSHTVKQILGAGAGMLIATVVYLGFDQISDLQLKGLLVSTETISPSTEISVNSRTADEATLRRIQTRAETVTRNLEASKNPAQAETPLTNIASSRRATREFAVQLKELASTAKTYSNDPNVLMTETDRLAIRTARFAAAGDPPTSAGTQVAGIQGVPTYVPQTVIQRVEVPVDREVIKEVIKEVPRDVIRTVIKEVPVYMSQPVRGKGLPDSGPGLIMLVGSSAGLALQRAYRRRKDSR